MEETRAAWFPVLRDTVLVTAAAAMAGVAFNALRPDRLPLVAQESYQILVPCPEAAGEAHALKPDDPALGEPGAVLVDARGAAEYAAWHAERAVSVPYDFLEPVSPAAVQELANSGASRVVVYGDGGDPDTGRELAREIAGKGLRNVFFVEGGAPALRARQEASP